MLWSAEYIEPERRQPYLHGALTIAVVVPVALLWWLIAASLFMGTGDLNPLPLDIQLYGP